MIIKNQNYQPIWTHEKSEVYHANKEYVNSSSLKRILKSPKSFLSSLTEENKPTPAMQLGSLIHTAILEPQMFEQVYVVEPNFGDCRTAANKARRDEWRAQNVGRVPIDQETQRIVVGISESIYKHADAQTILAKGHKERSGYYADPETGILCRIRPDFYSEGMSAIVDLKTSESCEEESFSRTMWNYRYDIQMAMYSHGAEVIDGKSVDNQIFIVAEKTAPFEVAVYIADNKVVQMGLSYYRHALKKLSKSIETNDWSSFC